jgi:hypothetical protein
MLTTTATPAPSAILAVKLILPWKYLDPLDAQV